jgi:hypothetical protein
VMNFESCCQVRRFNAGSVQYHFKEPWKKNLSRVITPKL